MTVEDVIIGKVRDRITQVLDWPVESVESVEVGLAAIVADLRHDIRETVAHERRLLRESATVLRHVERLLATEAKAVPYRWTGETQRKVGEMAQKIEQAIGRDEPKREAE